MICSHFGWTLDYLQEGITWSVVQRMLIDAPTYKYDEDNQETSKKVNSKEKEKFVNDEELMNFFNKNK